MEGQKQRNMSNTRRQRNKHLHKERQKESCNLKRTEMSRRIPTFSVFDLRFIVRNIQYLDIFTVKYPLYLARTAEVNTN
jgi:hypothetical protein